MMTRYTIPIAAPIDGNGRLAATPADEVPIVPEGPPGALVDLPDGCYRLTYTPSTGQGIYRGAVRVDRGEGSLIMSGDLYFFPPGGDQPDDPHDWPHPLSPGLIPVQDVLTIPVYPRRRYHSYLRGTAAWLFWPGLPPRQASLSFQQYDYTAPGQGLFDGSFPPDPGSREITMRVFPKTAPPILGIGTAYFEGTWLVGDHKAGTVTLAWVSPSFRRCRIEIDTVAGAVAPQPVESDGTTEDVDTMLASAGWDATVVRDQTEIPVPEGVDPNAQWEDGALHALMSQVRDGHESLDDEWRLHVIVVPATMGCGRGRMYDSIDVPREGVASFSDDGYPTADSSWFGAAQNQKQRDVPRAFLRSACHEVTHGMNQIHQEIEAGPDNSIMTTTPSVADVLKSVSSGDPGVFPDDIRLRVNSRVRRHLAHFPDPVVRPGGHTFSSWWETSVPTADRLEVGPEYLSLTVSAEHDRIHLGEPLALTWELTNTSADDVAAPSEVTQRSTYGRISVMDAAGVRRTMPPYVIECDQTSLAALAPGATLRADARVYWSTRGFAFERPGRYIVEIVVIWSVAGTPLIVRGSTPIFVDYPMGQADNEAAAALLHPEVGKWVALGGGAPHLVEAQRRLRALAGGGEAGGAQLDADASAAPGALRGYAGLLPDSPAPARRRAPRRR